MLFGAGKTMTPRSELSQPDQFAAVETVNLIGPKGRIERVRILGPARKESQVEISRTEQFKLGIDPPVRDSGDLEGTPGITIEGDAGTVKLDKGVICAKRHIHISPEEALNLGLRDKDVVMVKVKGVRELIFGDVLVRVNPKYRLDMHLDTDEANAAQISTGTFGYIEAIQHRNYT
jgi:acetate kinase